MKRIFILVSCLFLIVLFDSCEESSDGYLSGYGVTEEKEPNAPDEYSGRTNVGGTEYHVSSRDVTFYVWDDGALIDGDIITLVVNGTSVLSNYTLQGPGSKKAVNVKLDNTGYNWVLLFAHNEGTSPPNTSAVSCDDGSSTQIFSLSSDLSTNGFAYIVVD
ncbi:hypothetical protein ACFLTI_01855 [Bacteroidota bacterium]